MVVGPPGTGKTDTAVQILQVRGRPHARVTRGAAPLLACAVLHWLSGPSLHARTMAPNSQRLTLCASRWLPPSLSTAFPCQVLYHNCPGQRTLLITHSNQALNDLFAKMVAR
jgi:hypothetical protein